MKVLNNYRQPIKQRIRCLARIAFFSVFILSSLSADAAEYFSQSTGSFTTGTRWSTQRTGGTVVAYPGAAHTYTIQSGHNISITAATTAAGINIETGGTLTATTFGLTINGSWINDGTFNDGTTAIVTFGGVSSINGTTNPQNFQNVTVASGASLTINSPVALAGNFVYAATAANTIVTIAGTNSLSVAGTWSMPRPNTGFTSTIAVDAGTLSVTGTFTMSATTGTRTNNMTISTGAVNLGAITTGTTACLITFTGAGTLSMSGTVSTGPPALTPSTGTVKFSGGAQTVWVETYNNLTLEGTGTKTMSATRTVNGVLTLEGTATVSAALTYGANATLRYNTSNNRTAGAEWPATFAATGGVIIDAMTITTNNSKTFNLDVPLTINTGATLSPASGHTFSFGGDLINDGTWTPSDGAVTITGARTVHSIGSFSTSGLVTMSKASGTATFTRDISGGAFTMNGAGILNLGTGLTHTFTGAWTNTAGTLQGNTSTLNIGGTGSGTGVTFTANTSMVDFNGSGAQNIPAFTYYNLNTSTGNTKTLLGNAEVANVLTINPSSTFATGAFTLTLSGTGTPLVDNGTFTATAGGTVIYSGATANIAAESYANLQTSTAGVKTLAGTTTVNNILTINSPSTLDLSSVTLILSAAGTPLVNNGTFTCSTSTISFSNASSTNIPALNYYNLTLSGGPRVLAGSGTIGIANTFTPGGGGFTVTGSTVNFNGAAQTIPVFTFNDLILSGSGSKTILTATTVSANAVEIQDGPTLDLPGTAVINVTKP